ncbi:MAG TPA: YaiI/YqxD family protein [Syntrophomonadaceae bacterium]|nr:YaiI/YqxD family protein [Syntrophomonadaceae bacterium]
MRILVDADACPVKKIIEEVARSYQVEVIMVVNPHHQIDCSYGQVLAVDGESQSVDLAIANLAQVGDIVVTQDYGLACLALGRRSRAIHPNGWRYDSQHIDALLSQRHLNDKARRGGFKTTSTPKRASSADRVFRQTLVQMMDESQQGPDG